MITVGLLLTNAWLSQRSFLANPLTSDFLIANSTELGSTYENSAGSARADRNGENLIFIAAGKAQCMVKLRATIDGVKDGGRGVVSPLPKMNGLYPVTDNNVVRTEGAMLAQWDGATEENYTPAPGWWQTHRMTWFANKIGMKLRGCAVFVKYDISKDTWARSKPLDLLSISNGEFAKPRPYNSSLNKADIPGDLTRNNLKGWKSQGKYSDGALEWFPAGIDRTEIYACPFTGNIYLAGRIISGPYSQTDNQENTMLLMASSDQGLTWQWLTTLDAWSPAVMTSTPDGRLWIEQVIGNSDGVSSRNVLTYTEPLGRFKMPKTFKKAEPSYANQKGSGPEMVDMELKVSCPSICRLLDDPKGSSVLIAYQVRNDYGNQEYRVVKATITPGGKYVQEPAFEIRATREDTHSVMYGTFIQPELVGEPDSRYTDTSLFYWYDARRDANVKDGGFSVRYRVFRKGKGAETGYLSQKRNNPRFWKTAHNPGDYMKGASFVADGKRVAFIPQWSEADGIHGQFLSTK